MKCKSKQHKEINNYFHYEKNDLIKLYSQRNELKDHHYSNCGFSFDKKKKKRIKLGTNEDNPCRHKHTVKKNDRIIEQMICSRNISQVNSFTDNDKDKLINNLIRINNDRE